MKALLNLLFGRFSTNWVLQVKGNLALILSVGPGGMGSSVRSSNERKAVGGQKELVFGSPVKFRPDQITSINCES